MKTGSKFAINVLTLITMSILSGCAIAHSNFVPVNKVQLSPTEATAVEYNIVKPKRNAIALGVINVNGNGFSSHQDLIKEAKIKAATLGGDFIFQENAGAERKTFYNPGYSSYESNGNAYANKHYGSANQNTSGYSVGPSVSTVDYPWAVFSVWKYTPFQSGVDYDEKLIITGFHLNSDACSAGIEIGDKIIGIDGMDVKDERLSQHSMKIKPGDHITYSVLREGKRMEFTVTALPNY